MIIDTKNRNIAYVSEHIKKVLNFKHVRILIETNFLNYIIYFLISQDELCNRNIFQFIHSDDQIIFQNQLSLTDCDNSKMISSKTSLINRRSTSSKYSKMY
jgi:hypothetical protein